MVLSAQDIINGIDDYKEVKIESANDTVYLRPLSKAEWESTNKIRQDSLGDYVTNEKAKAVSRTQRISNIESQLKFNIGENSEADLKAQIEAIYLSMNNDGYAEENTREQIKKFPSDVFDEIYENVKEISGVSEEAVETMEDDVDEFPEDK